MATSVRWVMRYNPEWVEKFDVYQIAAVIVHEVSHVLRKHHKRFQHLKDALDLILANIAMDMAINPDLKDGGWQLPACGVFPAKYGFKNGLTAEDYYALLKEKQKKGEITFKSSPNGTPVLGQSNGGEDQEPSVGGGACGGCATHSDEDEDEQQTDAEIGRSQVEIEGILLKTANDIKQHASQGRGNMPGLFKELADFLLEPKKVDWRQTLGGILRQLSGRITSGGMDLSLKRPSKRSYTRGLLRPGLIQKLPEICIIRDTSGSMGYPQLKEATSESCHVIQSVGVDTIWFFDADTKGSVPERVTAQKLLSMPIHGRGGTDFVGPLKQASELMPRPDIIIYMTDGDGGAPSKPPAGIEVVWCIVSSYYNKAPAEWGHHVFLGEKRK